MLCWFWLVVPLCPLHDVIVKEKVKRGVFVATTFARKGLEKNAKNAEKVGAFSQRSNTCLILGRARVAISLVE